MLVLLRKYNFCPAGGGSREASGVQSLKFTMWNLRLSVLLLRKYSFCRAGGDSREASGV